MKKYKENFSDEEIRQALFKNDSKAKEIIGDPNKWEGFKKKMYAFLEKAADIPVIGPVVDDIVTMVEVVDSYVKKEYTNIPWISIVTIVCVLIYILSPIDLIPDVLPIIGYVDDVAVVFFALKLVGVDLNKYRKWQEENRQVVLENIEKVVGKEISELLADKMLGAIVLCDDTFQVLIVEDEEDCEKPFDCTVQVLNIPTDILNDNSVKGEKEYLEFLNDVVEKTDFKWSPIGKLEAIHEADFNKYEDYFAVITED